MADTVYDSVKEYYGKIVKKTGDLKTNVCTTCGKPPKHIGEVLTLIHPEVESKYYGCGLVVPSVLEGMRVLDLGSGSGRDCFVLSKLVGESGFVVGVDMTKEQVDIAKKYIDYHMEKFGFSKPNIEFRQGYIEKLNELGFQDNSFDIIVSNCVINLSPDKAAVLREAFRVLKQGGELYFSDVYSDRRIPRDLAENTVLYGECLGGALYRNDFLHLAKQVGFVDPRLVEDRPISVQNKKLEELVGHINFFSATYRLFKIPSLEPACEDYGQAVIYKGGIPTSPKSFTLDMNHIIQSGKVFPVCGNTYQILKQSRFASFFEFIGDQSNHFGAFKCVNDHPNNPGISEGGCCASAPSASEKTQGVGDRKSVV